MDPLNMVMEALQVLANGINANINLSIGSLIITGVNLILNGMMFIGIGLLVWKYVKK